LSFREVIVHLNVIASCNLLYSVTWVVLFCAVVIHY